MRVRCFFGLGSSLRELWELGGEYAEEVGCEWFVLGWERHREVIGFRFWVVLENDQVRSWYQERICLLDLVGTNSNAKKWT